MDQLEREVTMQTASLKLYLTEDFQEAARAFAEKRQPGPLVILPVSGSRLQSIEPCNLIRRSVASGKGVSG